MLLCAPLPHRAGFPFVPQEARALYRVRLDIAQRISGVTLSRRLTCAAVTAGDFLSGVYGVR